jgi:hypothetical protein
MTALVLSCCVYRNVVRTLAVMRRKYQSNEGSPVTWSLLTTALVLSCCIYRNVVSTLAKM